MGKDICIIHANCQGEPLLERLMLCPSFAERYECTLVTNYTREPMPESITSASLLLYQHLGPQWGELASETVIRRLPANARSLCIPNMFFMGYWPLWYSAPGFNYRDRRLDDLLDMDLPDEETLTLFLRQPIKKYHDLDRLLDETFQHEAEREAHTPIKYLDFIRENWRTRRLFNTINHPGSELMALAAHGVLTELGLEPVPMERLCALPDPFPEFELPVHPLVADHYGLGFAGPDAQYAVYGQTMTFAAYVAHYIDCRRNGITDFISYLRARAANV